MDKQTDMANNCWENAIALSDQFREDYPRRAQDMDGFARNFIRLSDYINNTLTPIVKELVKENSTLKDENTSLRRINMCVRSKYLDTVDERDKELYEGVVDALTPRILSMRIHEQAPARGREDARALPASRVNEPR